MTTFDKRLNKEQRQAHEAELYALMQASYKRFFACENESLGLALQTTVDNLHLLKDDKKIRHGNQRLQRQASCHDGVRVNEQSQPEDSLDGYPEAAIAPDQKGGELSTVQRLHSNYPVNNGFYKYIFNYEALPHDNRTAAAVIKTIKEIALCNPNIIFDLQLTEQLDEKRIDHANFRSAAHYYYQSLQNANQDLTEIAAANYIALASLESSLEPCLWYKREKIKINRNLQLAALEAIMLYNGAGIKHESVTRLGRKYLQHTTCKSGKDRTFLVMAMIFIYSTFFKITGRLMPQTNFLAANDTLTPNPNYEAEVDQFQLIANHYFQAGIAQHQASRGGTQGCRGIIPKDWAFPTFIDQGLVKNCVKLSAAKTRKGFPCAVQSAVTMDHYLEVCNASTSSLTNIAQRQALLTNKLKQAVLAAVTEYMNWLYLQRRDISNEGSNTSIGLFRQHGAKGYQRATQLQILSQAQNTEFVVFLEQLKTAVSKSARGNHSLNSYIMRELHKERYKDIRLLILLVDSKALVTADTNVGFFAHRRRFRSAFRKSLDCIKASPPSTSPST